MIHQILQAQYPFYKKLNETEKLLFQKRVQDFIKGRDFRGRKGLVVTDDMKVLISACAIQITFKLEKFWFPYYNSIMVFPSDYFELIKKRYQKGIIKHQGAITIGWESLQKHVEDEIDFNIGLHEFAHALYVENTEMNEGYYTIPAIELKPDLSIDIPFIDAYHAHSVQQVFATEWAHQ